MKNRKTYSKEFKLDAIALVRDQNYCSGPQFVLIHNPLSHQAE